MRKQDDDASRTVRRRPDRQDPRRQRRPPAGRRASLRDRRRRRRRARRSPQQHGAQVASAPRPRWPTRRWARSSSARPPTRTPTSSRARRARARRSSAKSRSTSRSIVRAPAPRPSKRAGVVCMIGFQRRFDPTFSALKERLVKGEIGEPEMLVVTSRDPGAPPVDYLKRSGGIFRDMLIHDFDVFRWILDDDAATIYATGSVLTDPAVGSVGDVDSTRGDDPHQEGPARADQHQPPRRVRLRPALRGAGQQGHAAGRQPQADRGQRRRPRPT